jgi:hypothetical protein
MARCCPSAKLHAISKQRVNSAASEVILTTMPTATRGDVQKGEKYSNAIAEINKKQRELDLLQHQKNLLLDSMSQEAQRSQVAIAPKYYHAEEALEWVKKGTAREPRTVVQAVKLLNEGLLPGKYFDVKVKILSGYVSKVKSKIESGQELHDQRGKPSKLNRFEIEFIRSTLETQQMNSKAVLLSTVQLLVRVTLLIQRGHVAVETLDERVMLKQSKPKKRGRQRPQKDLQDEEDSDTDDDDADDEAARIAREESFTKIKQMLGDALSMSLAEPGITRYPTRRQVRKLCKKEGWYVRKAQQTASWRFEGCTPPMISRYFSNVIRIFVEFNIVTPGQKGNCDEKRLNAEFEKSARLLKVVCVKPSLLLSGHGRIAMTNSASSNSIVGVTFLPFILADNTCALIIIIRLGNPDSADSKAKEAEIWNEVHADYERAGIEVVVMTTPTGYMIGSAFVHCICHYMRVMLRRENVQITFNDPRNPSMEECPRLTNAQILFLDNASHHKMGDVKFQCECRFRNLQLTPFPPNTTNVSQPLDQEVNKFFTLWVKQLFLLEMEMEMAGGIKNSTDLCLWAQQIPWNAPASETPMCVELDLSVDLTSNLGMSSMVKKLNATLARANTEGRKFDETRVNRICLPAWLAAFKFARKSFVTAGLAAPDANLGAVLRGGRMNQLQLEHAEEMLTRYEVFPERITQTAIYRNAAEKWAKLQENAQQDRLQMLERGAQLVGAVPDVRKRALTVGSAAADRDEVATKSAVLVFGPHPPEDAIALSKVLLQASIHVQDEEQRRLREDGYVRGMPVVGEGSMEAQMQEIRDSGAATMHEKLKTVKRSFEIVAEHAQVLQRACSKLETQWQPFSAKEALNSTDIKKLQALLRSIHDMTNHATKPLAERVKDLQAELGKKVESRASFLEKSRGNFVPETTLKEVLGDALNEDWGAATAVREAELAAARVAEFIFVEVAYKLFGLAGEVDDDVYTILVNMMLDDEGAAEVAGGAGNAVNAAQLGDAPAAM